MLFSRVPLLLPDPHLFLVAQLHEPPLPAGVSARSQIYVTIGQGAGSRRIGAGSRAGHLRLRDAADAFQAALPDDDEAAIVVVRAGGGEIKTPPAAPAAMGRSRYCPRAPQPSRSGADVVVWSLAGDAWLR